MNFSRLKRTAAGREANSSTSNGFDAIPTDSFDITPSDGREANSSTSNGFDAIPTDSFDTTPIDVVVDTVPDTVSMNDADISSSDISSGDITSSEYARKGREL